jgi:exosortase
MMAENTYLSDTGTQGESIVQNPKRDENCVQVPRKDWKDLEIHDFIKILIVAVLFGWLFTNEICILVRQWSDPNWSHGFLIPFFSLYLVNQRKQEILRLKSKANYLGLLLLICCIAFYPLNVVHFQYGYFRPLNMIATLAAIIFFLGGWPLLKYTWFPIAFLIFAVPLPQRLYVSVTTPLRFLAADVSAFMLNLVPQMDATVTGAIINVVYKGQPVNPPLDVADACSGMRSLLAFLALGVAMAYLHYRPRWQRLILLASTIPIAILCNVVRVTITGVISVLINHKYAQGIYHDLLGYAMFIVAFIIYYSLAWFMDNLFVEEVEPDTTNVVIRRGNR